MDEVADRAGVGRMTVYRRFGSRDHLEEALAVREARRCLAEIDSTVDPGAPVPDQIAQGLLTTLRLIREHPLLERMSRLEPATALVALRDEKTAVFAMSRAFLAARIREGQRAGTVDRSVDPEQAGELLVRLGFSFLLIPESALPLDDDAQDARAGADDDRAHSRSRWLRATAIEIPMPACRSPDTRYTFDTHRGVVAATVGRMGRTNIEIDDELIGRVMRRYGFRSKREAVERGLRALDIEPFSREEILELAGMGWDGDLDAMRRDAPTVRSWAERE